MRWDPMITNRLNYLSIQDQLEMRDNLFKGRYNIWETLFPLHRI